MAKIMNPEEGMERIVNTFSNLKEVEKLSKIIDKDEIVKNNYKISPSRYVYVTNKEIYKPIGEIVVKLKTLEDELKTIDKELKDILTKLGF